MSIKFRRFNPRSPGLPKKYRLCLVRIAAKEAEGLPVAIAVGYIKRGCQGAYWVIPGVGGDVTHYADCLGDDFPDRMMWEKM